MTQVKLNYEIAYFFNSERRKSAKYHDKYICQKKGKILGGLIALVDTGE